MRGESGSPASISGVTGSILAGGENRRYPSPKAFIVVDGQPIVERNLALLRSLFSPVFISTNQPAAYFPLGARLVGDVLPSRGPMSGIHSVLLNAPTEAVFVTACDMPFISAGAIRVICDEYLKHAAEGPVAAVIPVFQGEPQPLFGVYCRTALGALEEAVRNDKVQLKRFFEEQRVRYIAEEVVRAADPEGRTFSNINTPGDFERLSGRAPAC